jgi:hypothetical protein
MPLVVFAEPLGWGTTATSGSATGGAAGTNSGQAGASAGTPAKVAERASATGDFAFLCMKAARLTRGYSVGIKRSEE